MASLLDRIPQRWLVAAVRGVYQLPEPVRRLLAGRPIRSEGQQLDVDVQLLLTLVKLKGYEPNALKPEQARVLTDQSAPLTEGPQVRSVDVRELSVAQRPARLYTPVGLADGSPLLVYFHGGGWVVGSLNSHDNTCRFLADRAGARVLSVDYRLAPEHPFPAAVDDAIAAFDHARRQAAELGADPALVAVGGDSAGGNLAAVVCHQSALRGGPTPAFALLFYPVTDVCSRSQSRRRYAEGYFLTEAEIGFFSDNYVPDQALRTDPRCSVLLADDLSGFPPTYLATAGFDPLCDEGEEFADRLRAAGVAVAHRREPDLIHGFVSFLGVGNRCREATGAAAGALRAGFAVAAGKTVGH